jgi:hypothetical protein
MSAWPNLHRGVGCADESRLRAVLVDETDHDIWSSDLAFAGLGVDVGCAQFVYFAKSSHFAFRNATNEPTLSFQASGNAKSKEPHSGRSQTFVF